MGINHFSLRSTTASAEGYALAEKLAVATQHALSDSEAAELMASVPKHPGGLSVLAREAVALGLDPDTVEERAAIMEDSGVGPLTASIAALGECAKCAGLFEKMPYLYRALGNVHFRHDLLDMFDEFYGRKFYGFSKLPEGV